jgi:hypothetical protein
MSTEPEPVEWTNLETVIAFLERDGRTLTPNERRVIDGQRRINGLLFDAIGAILETFPQENAPPSIIKAREHFQEIPGKEPPGCGPSGS